MEKYDTARQATGANLTQCTKDEHYMPDNQGENTDTHSQELIPAFPRQLIGERVSM